MPDPTDHTSTNPTAAYLLIGDEILSGRTTDANITVLARAFARAGIDLVEVRVVKDDVATIVRGLDALRAEHDVVVTSGGIGPTHDDVTADAVAAAFGVPLGIRDDARALLAESVAARGAELTDGILRMARIPEGATLIENALSAAPGFSLGNVHVMAGVPSIFAAMVEAVLPSLPHGTPPVSRTLVVHRGESHFAAALGEVAADFPQLAIGSYPGQDEHGPRVEIVVRGTDAAGVEEAVARLETVLAPYA